MSETESKPEIMYTLVDMSTVEGIAFLVRAPLKNILLWAKIFGMQDKVTKRLDLITTVEQLQFLFWNSTQQPPPDDLETLVVKCAELSTRLPVNETSVEELEAQIPPELLKSAGQKRKEEEIAMGQGGKEVAPKGGKKAAAEKAPKAEKAVKEAKPKREKDPTGRPSAGTATGKVWEICDGLAKANKNVTPTRKEAIAACEAEGINPATAGVQYGAWFRGMERTPAPVVAKPVKEPKAKKDAPADAADTEAEGETEGDEDEDEESDDE